MNNRRLFIAGIASLLAAPALAQTGAQYASADLIRFEQIRGLGMRMRNRISELPIQGAMMTDHYRIRIGLPILLRSGSEVALSQQGVSMITVMAESLVKARNWRAEIVGHKSGVDSYQAYVVSRRAAEMMKAGLISRSVDASRLQTTGLGNRFPVSPHYQNDRIEFLLRPILKPRV